jgi:hypothetical protein
MPFSTKDIAYCLEHKFGFVRRQGNHVFLERLFPNGRVRTKVSHGRHETSRQLDSAMAKQLRVTTACFRGMISCSVSNEDYERHIAEFGPPS